MTPQPEDQPAPPKPKARKAVIGLVLLAVAGAGMVLLPQWRDRLGDNDFAPAGGGDMEVENLRAELAGLNARLAQMESRPAPPAGPAPGPAAESPAVPAPAGAVAGEVESLARQVADLKRSSADAGALLRLADRVERAEAALRELQARRTSAAALLLAVGQLREAVNLGLPFDSELRAVRVMAGEDGAIIAALDGLRGRAGQGIRTRPALTDAFRAQAAGLIRAEMLPDEDGWRRKATTRLLTLFSIRREDGTDGGTSTAAVVARAEAALARNDLAGAAAALGGLSGTPHDMAAAWVAEAGARLDADRALSEMAAQAIALAGARP